MIRYIMERIFKQIVLIQIILLPIIILLDYFFPVPNEIYYLPYFDGALSGISESAEIFLGIIAIALLITLWVSLFLIYFFNPVGRSIYVWIVVLATFSLLIGPTVSSALSTFIGTIDTLLVGATIVFMFFTSIKDKFNR